MDGRRRRSHGDSLLPAGSSLSVTTGKKRNSQIGLLVPMTDRSPE